MRVPSREDLLVNLVWQRTLLSVIDLLAFLLNLAMVLHQVVDEGVKDGNLVLQGLHWELDCRTRLLLLLLLGTVLVLFIFRDVVHAHFVLIKHDRLDDLRGHSHRLIHRLES